MTITWQLVLAIAAGFLCIVNALEKVQEIIKKSKEPSEDIKAKLQRDYDRINAMDEEIKEIKEVLAYLKDSSMLQIENDQVILEHMRTNNSTGKISKREEAIVTFLKEHQNI